MATCLSYAVPNALNPIITMAGIDIPWFIGGVVLVERVFNWPGVGRMAVEAIETVDSFRSRTAIEFTPSAATRLEIKAADRVIELIKSAATTNAESRWMLTRPLSARADQNKISEFLSDLSGLRSPARDNSRATSPLSTNIAIAFMP